MNLGVVQQVRIILFQVVRRSYLTTKGLMIKVNISQVQNQLGIGVQTKKIISFTVQDLRFEQKQLIHFLSTQRCIFSIDSLNRLTLVLMPCDAATKSAPGPATRARESYQLTWELSNASAPCFSNDYLLSSFHLLLFLVE